MATAARHTTAREAATALSTNESALWSMIRAIERRVGYELFHQDRMLIPPAVAHVSFTRRNAQSTISTQHPH